MMRKRDITKWGADVAKEYTALNKTERGIVSGFETSGMSPREALDRLYQDLSDAAEEDGYDGA
jgi:hypothetical protein